VESSASARGETGSGSELLPDCFQTWIQCEHKQAKKLAMSHIEKLWPQFLREPVPWFPAANQERCGLAMVMKEKSHDPRYK
jgi:hypothetical protein